MQDRIRYAILVPLALLLLAIVMGCSSVDKEIAKLRVQIKTHPKSGFYHEQLSLLLFGKGDKQGAIIEIDQAIRLEPENPFYYHQRGYFLEKCGKKPEALKDYLEAAELADKLQYFDWSHPETSQMNPENRQKKEYAHLYNFDAARLLEVHGSLRQAELRYEKAIALLSAFPPNTTQSNLEDYRKYIEEKIERSLAKIEVILAKDRPDAEWVRRQLPAFQLDSPGKSNMDATALQLERSLKSGKMSGPGLHLELGDYYLAAGDTHKAQIEFMAATEMDPKDSSAWFQLGWAYLLNNRLDDSAIALRKAAKTGDEAALGTAILVQTTAERFRRTRPVLRTP